MKKEENQSGQFYATIGVGAGKIGIARKKSYKDQADKEGLSFSKWAIRILDEYVGRKPNGESHQ